MKIAYITSRYPFPVEKGDKLRAFHQIKGLARHHDVYLFALTDDEVSPEQRKALQDYCKDIFIYPVQKWKRLFNIARAVTYGLPFQVGYFFDQSTRRRMVREIIQVQPDHVVAQLIRTTEYVKHLPFRKTMDYMDVFSFGAAQRSANGPFLQRPFYAYEKRLVSKYEQRIYASFDRHMIISHQDRDRLPLPYPESVAVVPNGVDTNYYTPQKSSNQWTVMFVGNMGYEPNVEAAEFLVRRVMPIVWKANPSATVCLAGARPDPRVRRLASERVTVTGWVRDIRDYYAAARIFVAPMFSGMGLQNKILEAMAMGKPCVTTTIVNNAIRAVPGEQISVGNSAPEIANQVVKFLEHPAAAEEMAVKGRDFVREHFDWSAQHELLRRLVTANEHQHQEVSL